MGEPKPLASLSSTLLARKGQAKPAMRPQGFGSFGNPFNGHDDLGWNDMGHDMRHTVPIHQDVHPEAVHEVPPVVLQREELAEELSLAPQDFHAPEMLVSVEQAEAVPDEAPFDAEPAYAEPAYAEPAIELEPVVAVPEVAPVAVLATRKVPIVAVKRAHKAAKSRTGKAAFTLRLDPERHLKLRLACAISRDSAQSIVTAALDQFLANLPEIDELARKVPGATR